MYSKIYKALKNVRNNEKGMTGLETAIILIAFVTVASVLAYSVLTAGIFAAERGKATVYQGLNQAGATLQVKGSVLGIAGNSTKLQTVQFNVALAVPDQTVDSQAVVINYWDQDVHSEGVTFSMALASGSTERGQATILENDEQFTVTVTIPSSANLTAYKTFTLQVMAPTGAALTISRTLPGSLSATNDLN